MKVKGTPVKYDMYGDKPCYHVELFEDELRLITDALSYFSDSRLFLAFLDYAGWSDDELNHFDEGCTQLGISLCKIEDGNTEPTGEVVPCDD